MKKRSFVAVVTFSLVVGSIALLSPPSGADTVSDGAALCATLQGLSSNATYTIPDGTYTFHPTSGGSHIPCQLNGATNTGITINGGTGVTLIGAMSCELCNDWTFNDINIQGDGWGGSGGPIGMLGGDGWTWSDCDITNLSGGVLSGSYDLMSITDSGLSGGSHPTNWTVDSCNLHDNGQYAGSAANQNHIFYVNCYHTCNDHSSWSGTISNNEISGTEAGFPIKIGYGASSSGDPGVTGITVDHNNIHDNQSSDGLCGVGVIGDSRYITVSYNTISCPTGTQTSAVGIASYIGGNVVSVTENNISGTLPGSLSPRTFYCGHATYASQYDQSISGSFYVGSTHFQLAPTSCNYSGIWSTYNTVS